ncbi:hypothetical protein DAPPUDRAFT_125941, partial [Daphnia pulex]
LSFELSKEGAEPRPVRGRKDLLPDVISEDPQRREAYNRIVGILDRCQTRQGDALHFPAIDAVKDTVMEVDVAPTREHQHQWRKQYTCPMCHLKPAAKSQQRSDRPDKPGRSHELQLLNGRRGRRIRCAFDLRRDHRHGGRSTTARLPKAQGNQAAQPIGYEKAAAHHEVQTTGLRLEQPMHQQLGGRRDDHLTVTRDERNAHTERKR